MTIDNFIQTYGSLPDAVIKEVTFLYPNGSDENVKKCRVKIECRNISENYRWEIIEITFIDVQHFSLTEAGFTNQIISEAMCKELDGLVVLDFAFYEEWSSLEALKRSPFYVAARTFTIAVKEIFE